MYKIQNQASKKESSKIKLHAIFQWKLGIENILKEMILDKVGYIKINDKISRLGDVINTEQ